MELLSSKIGLILCVLGAMHFFNLLAFSSLRRKNTLNRIARPADSKEK